MDLLPKSRGDFRRNEYWEGFFRKRGKKSFEWYGEYGELCGVLHKYIKPTDKVLHIGCGNSTLSADLYDVGYKNQVNIDLSEMAIKQMSHMHKGCRPELVFQRMDVTAMDSTWDDSFNAVVDKGTLDAMMTDDSTEVVASVSAMFAEVDRVLRLGGRYLCVSLLQPHILAHVVDWFCDRGWPIRVLRCSDVEANKTPEQRMYPVFAVVATKFRKMDNCSPILEISLSSGSSHLTRLKHPDDLVGSVRGIQQFAAVRAGSARGHAFENADKRYSGDDVSLDLLWPGSDAPRYSIYLVDNPRPSSQAFAVFIVPQGREAEWLFNSSEGRQQLAESASAGRLLVVHLCRDHTYTDLGQIKTELSGYAMDLSPHDMPAGIQVPFLSLGGDIDVGVRTERCRGKSLYSGEYVVEDVTVNGEVFRRLVFLANAKLVQSEAKISTGKRKTVDKSYLACAHHSVMIGSLGLFPENCPINVLLVGLGGGGLATYINSHFSKVEITAVEIDEAVIRVAKDQFGFRESERLRVVNADGLGYIEELSKTADDRYNVIMLDVDSKDATVGMSSPPKPFLNPDFLMTIKMTLSKSQGFCIINMSCRDSKLRAEVLTNVKRSFKTVISYDVPLEVNEILFCTDLHLTIDLVTQAFKKANSLARAARKSQEDLIDVCEAVERLKMA